MLAETTMARVAQQELLRVDGVRKVFPARDHGEDVVALQDISFSVGDGEVVVLIGASGCGKTTLLRIIMGLERPTAGRVVVDGRESRGCAADRAMVFQHAALLPWRSALANVEFGLEVQGVAKAERRERALRALELVGLARAADRYPHELSGGMAQRAGLARALAVDPKVLLMDEPFAALDAQTRMELQGEVLRLQSETGKTVVFVTHDLDEAVLLADRIILLTRGGTIGAVFDVDIPGSRLDTMAIRSRDEFLTRRAELWDALTGRATEVA